MQNQIVCAIRCCDHARLPKILHRRQLWTAARRLPVQVHSDPLHCTTNLVFHERVAEVERVLRRRETLRPASSTVVAHIAALCAALHPLHHLNRPAAPTCRCRGRRRVPIVVDKELGDEARLQTQQHLWRRLLRLCHVLLRAAVLHEPLTSGSSAPPRAHLSVTRVERLSNDVGSRFEGLMADRARRKAKRPAKGCQSGILDPDMYPPRRMLIEMLQQLAAASSWTDCSRLFTRNGCTLPACASTPLSACVEVDVRAVRKTKTCKYVLLLQQSCTNRYITAAGRSSDEKGKRVRIDDAWPRDPATDRKRRIRIHRWICMDQYGPPATVDHEAVHVCGNSACVAPDHLRWATPEENRLDRAFHLIHSPVIIDGETRRFSRYTSCDDDENQLPLSPECV